jgi:hypothetical protein
LQGPPGLLPTFPHLIWVVLRPKPGKEAGRQRQNSHQRPRPGCGEGPRKGRA